MLFISDKDALWEILIFEMALKLDCQAVVCTHGVDGARWKTPALEAELAMQMLNIKRVVPEIKRPVEVVAQLNMVVEVESSLPRYHDQ